MDLFSTDFYINASFVSNQLQEERNGCPNCPLLCTLKRLYRTLLPTLGTVLDRFPSVRRLILVADRGLLSLDNLESVREIRLANGRALEFILAVPGRCYNEVLKELRALHKTQCQDATAG